MKRNIRRTKDLKYLPPEIKAEMALKEAVTELLPSTSEWGIR